MADKKLVELLKKGPEVWNHWRRDVAIPGRGHSRIDLSGLHLPGACLRRLDLRQADLRGANLRHANLREADLREANLRHADLRQADLGRADLRGAHLSVLDLSGGKLRHAILYRSDLTKSNICGADFSWANLCRASLCRANLRLADLYEADLSWANLTESDLTESRLIGAVFVGANLTGANLSRVVLLQTVFVGCTLLGARDLDSCMHLRSSFVDISTLQSSGSLPLAFLRGCGLPETLIDIVSSFTPERTQFYSCFISYSSKDDAFARRLHADLQDKGVRCWFAPEHMKTGDSIRDRIEKAIREGDKLLIVLSRNSIKSTWVENEVEKAFEEEQRRRKRDVLFPIRIDDAIMKTRRAWAATLRRTRHVGDFRRWKEHEAYTKALERLLRDLRAERTGDGVKRKEDT